MTLEEIKIRLEKEKEEIMMLLQSFEKESEEILKEPVFSTDELADRYEFKQETHLRKDLLEERLANINKALKKIDEGTYGICEKCGKKIEEIRLKIDPAIFLCRDCALK